MKEYKKLAISGGKKTIPKKFKKHQSIGKEEINASIKTLCKGILYGVIASRSPNFYEKMRKFENKIKNILK